jgi:spermidine synthase
MRRLSCGVLLMSLSTLVLELMLTRVFDVTLTPNLSYFVVSLAIFSFGLAGLFSSLRPLDPRRPLRTVLTVCSFGFSGSALLLTPLINALPLDYHRIVRAPLVTLGAYFALYLVLLVPFFLAGYVLISVFSGHAARIQRLYFWDLLGAGLGTLIVIPFILRFGPGGLIVCAAAVGLIAAALFSESRNTTIAACILAIAIAAVPIVRGQHYIEYRFQIDKRGILTAISQGRDVLTRWDPISRIDVIDERGVPGTADPPNAQGHRFAIQYDGGNQTSYFYRFDGNLQRLRASLRRDPALADESFWQIGVLASHYLKRDTHASVLVIGSAGGEETKAALMYGARRVDAVELVPTVMRLGKGRFSSYIGNVLRRAAVHTHVGDGRSFLAHSHRKYDIIQIYSDYTSSSIAQGTGAMAPMYLQTAQAYEEYFSHLTPGGVLQVNNFAYPRMITTAALAWRRLGLKNFQRHVAVYFCPGQLTLPTLLFKRSAWTAAEIADLDAFLGSPKLAPRERLHLVENPLDPSRDFLSPVFYSGRYPGWLSRKVPADFSPVTDDHPFYGNLRRSIRYVKPDAGDFLDPGTADVLNSGLIRGIPMDEIQYYLMGGASLVFVILFVLVPLRLSRIGREQGAAAAPLLGYFACLGAGFITLELVFIQKFMNVIGSPLYTYSTVIFTLLAGAGIGSAASERLGICPRHRWMWPFLAVIALGVALVLSYPWVARIALALPLAGRVVLSGALILPIGFFLGMPFPLGVLALEGQPRGAVAWAWGMNGLFTVVGSLASVLLSLAAGFRVAIFAALLCYAGALALFPMLRDRRPRERPVAEATTTS